MTLRIPTLKSLLYYIKENKLHGLITIDTLHDNLGIEDKIKVSEVFGGNENISYWMLDSRVEAESLVDYIERGRTNFHIPGKSYINILNCVTRRNQSCYDKFLVYSNFYVVVKSWDNLEIIKDRIGSKDNYKLNRIIQCEAMKMELLK